MKIGCLGMGQMAMAMAGGWIKQGIFQKEEVLAYAPHQDKLKANADRIGFTPCSDPLEMAEACDWILLAVKPYQIEAVMTRELKEAICGKVLISVAAGWSFDRFRALLGDRVRIQCIMPNTPALVGLGVMLFEEENSLTEEEGKKAEELMKALGAVHRVPGRLMGIAGAMSGCTPAYMDMMIEAYGDVGVKYGLPRALAYQLIAESMEGSARLFLESGRHPGQLKDAVCSPAGTTICGVEALEAGGFRYAVMSSIEAIMNKKN